MIDILYFFSLDIQNSYPSFLYDDAWKNAEIKKTSNIATGYSLQK